MGFRALIVAVDERRMGGLVAAAKNACDSVEAIVIGDEKLAESVSKAGIDAVTWLKAEEGVPPEAYAPQVACGFAASGFQLVISNDGPEARMVLGAVSGAIGAAVVGNVIDVAVEGDRLVAKRAIANGLAIESVAANGSLAAIYVGEDAELVPRETLISDFDATTPSAKVVGVMEATTSGLADARRVVGVGMGVAARDNLPIVEGLASALGAEIACTLPCCDDMRWYGSDRVLGSSHNTASPDLYVAVGISGSPNHTSGFRDAKVAVAINNDPDAEIFSKCKYGICGDLFDVVPALTAALS